MDTDLSHANLTNTNWRNTNLSNGNFTGVDMRGASGLIFQPALFPNAITGAGTVFGLDLAEGDLLRVRDYDGNPQRVPPLAPIAIKVKDHLAMSGTGRLELSFEADPWDSLISFDPGISVDLGGVLELDFAADVNLLSQVGRTLELFDWTGVTPTGSFTVQSPYVWDLSQLYTTGEVTLLSAPTLPGDFDADGDVDGADFLAWQRDPTLGAAHRLASQLRQFPQHRTRGSGRSPRTNDRRAPRGCWPSPSARDVGSGELCASQRLLKLRPCQPIFGPRGRQQNGRAFNPLPYRVSAMVPLAFCSTSVIPCRSSCSDPGS